jgi:hypothetical protein
MKGNGNSRYLKTVEEALSLYPTYEDFLQAMIAGTFPVDFNGINKDGWTQLGTPLNKANLLSDTVISTLGLSTGANSTPNDAFNVLANVGNVHVWRKTVITEEEIPAGYTLGSIQTNVEVFSGGSQSQSILWYNDSPDVDAAGNVLVKNGPGSNNYVFYANSNFNIDEKMVGKFIEINPGGDYTAIPGVWFVPSDAMVTVRDYKIYSSKIQKVTGYPAVPPGTHVTYLTSVNRNAYQEGDDAKEAGYVLGDMVSGYLFASAWTGNASNYYYSETIKVSDTGTLTQENVKSYTANATNDSWVSNIQSAIRGKFITVSGEKDNGGSEGTDLVYIPDDAIVSYFENGVSLGYPYNYGFLVNKMQQVTGYPAIPAGTTIEYLGVLGNKTIIETGSYVGTGTYGKANPQTLTFNFDVKFFVLQGHDRNNYQIARIAVKGSDLFGSSSATNSTGLVTWNGSTVSWYGDDAPDQGNKQGSTYYYVALG